MQSNMEVPVTIGGTMPYAAIKINFTIAVAGDNKAICYLTDSSSGIITYTAGEYSSTWAVNGKTVTRTGGTATSQAYYVTNDVLYAQNLSSAYTGGFAGEIENVIIRIDSLSPIETRTGSTLTDLFTAIQKLSTKQQENCAIRLTTDAGTHICRKSSSGGEYNAFLSGASSFTNILLLSTGCYRRIYYIKSSTQHPTAPDVEQTTLTVSSWVLTYPRNS